MSIFEGFRVRWTEHAISEHPARTRIALHLRRRPRDSVSTAQLGADARSAREAVLGPARHTFHDIVELDHQGNRLKLGPIRAVWDAARSTRNLPPVTDLDLLIRNMPLPWPRRRARNAAPEPLIRIEELGLVRQSDLLELADAMESFRLTRKKVMDFRLKLTITPMLPCVNGRCNLFYLPTMSVRFLRVLTPGDWTLHLERDAAGVPCPYNVMVDLAPLATDVDAHSLVTGRYPQENGIELGRREYPQLRTEQDCRHVKIMLYGSTVVRMLDGEYLPHAGFMFL
jgi:hypothetical protein